MRKKQDLIHAYGVWAGYGTGIMVLDRNNKYKKMAFLADLTTQDDVKLFLDNAETIANMPGMDAASFNYYYEVAEEKLNPVVPEPIECPVVYSYQNLLNAPTPSTDPWEKQNQEEITKWEKELLPNVVEEDNGDGNGTW